MSCQGKLTDEQKKELREGMEANRIRKVSEADIIDAAFFMGRDISKKMGNDFDSLKAKSLSEVYNARIYRLKSGDSLLMQIEQQIIEAYVSSANVALADNIQKIGNDSLLYTFPVMDTLQDRSIVFKFALGIMIPKKEIVLSIEQ